MGNPIQLPTDVQQILDANDPRFADVTPNAPQLNVTANPAPTAPQIGPANPAPPTSGPGSFSDHFSNGMAATLADPAAASQIFSQPGGFAKFVLTNSASALAKGGSFGQKLIGALDHVGAGLGDASAATENLPQGVGAVGGVTRTLAARSKRLNDQHQQEFQDNILSQREQREQESARSNIALNNVAMAVHQQQLQNGSEEAQNRVFTSNQNAVKSREEAGYTVEHGVTESDLTSRMNNFKGENGEHFSDEFDAIPVGAMTVNGQKVQTFDIVKRQPGLVTPAADERAFIKQYGGPELAEGTQVSNVDLTSMRLRAQRVAAAQHQIEETTQRAMSDDQKKILSKDLQSTAVQHALALHPEDRIAGITEGLQQANEHVKHAEQLVAAAQQHGDPQAIQEATKYQQQAQQELKSLQNVGTFAFTKEDFENHRKAVEDRQRDADRREREQDRRDAKEKDKTYQQAHEAWQQSLADNDFNPVTAREALRKSNPKALAALADEESKSSQITESTDPVTGETRQTTKGRPTFFAVPGQQNAPQTAGQAAQPTGAAGEFQQSQDQEEAAKQKANQDQQAQRDQRPAEEPIKIVAGQRVANPVYTPAEAYIASHPQLKPEERAAVRKQYANQQQGGQLPKPPQQGAQLPPAAAAQYLQAAGGDKQKARALAQQNGWSF